ncbi:MAG: prephenate dehydrogenase [Eubacteriales bacterium]|nr:prephenate dehydrogenase [Eubacteriales bacterium]
MELNRNTEILIVGLGVIGGGYARALTRQGYRVSCITKEQKDIDYAVAHGIIHSGYTEPRPEILAAAELVVLALYPHTAVEWMRENQNFLSPGTLVTDVTGVKARFIREMQAFLRTDIEFISAHPMAGRESSGVEYSNDEVFRGANYIVVPTDRNTREGIAVCRRLGEILGFGRISELDAESHDRMIAFLSQLTHCIAVALMNCHQGAGLESYTGDSFRDLTRIAKINDEMWSELFLWNREALLAQMEVFEKTFDRLRGMLERGDREGMREMMRISTRRRTLFDKERKETV